MYSEITLSGDLDFDRGYVTVHFQGQEELRSLDAGEEVDRSLSARQTGRGLSQVSNVLKTLSKK